MLSRLNARLADIGRGLHSAAEEAVQTAARRALDAARQNAPVDTGRLRNSLYMKASDAEASVVSDCPYAPSVELGSARHAPQPFMVPAAEAQRADFLRNAALLTKQIF